MPVVICQYCRGVSPKIANKANQLLSVEHHPRKTIKKGYLTLAVNRRYRLLSTDDGKSWMLLTHSTYNRMIDK